MSRNKARTGRETSAATNTETTDKPARRRTKAWPRIAMIAGVMAVIVLVLYIFGPDGATYDEYLQLVEGMPRQQVEEIVGEGDYWYHMEGEFTVASWVNDDGTYIKTVFDKDDVLLEASWETGWDPARESDTPPAAGQ